MPLSRRSSKGTETFPKQFRPIGLDLTVFDLLGARDDLSQPLAFDGRRYPVVANFGHFPPTRRLK